MDRKQAERLINDVLYGVDTPEGKELLLELIEEMGTSALTDEAVIKLAELQDRTHDARTGGPTF